MDEPNGFVYVATYNPQGIIQFRATVKTADEKSAVAGNSTVALKLTAVRLLEGFQPPLNGWGQIGAIAVLSPSTLLVAHYNRTLHANAHAAGLC
jgi:hypothetical protein